MSLLILVIAPAPCCTNWNGPCYDVSNANSNYHACNECGGYPDPCFGDCDNDPTSDGCTACCINQEHRFPWNCPGK